MSPETQYSDAELLHLLKHDSVDAFEILYKKYWYDLYLLAASKTGRDDIGQEIAQQLFENLWKKRSDLHIDNLRHYLFASLKHLVIDHIRHHLIEERHVEHLKHYLTVQPAHNTAEIEELNKLVENELKKLPEKTQYIFHLSRYEFQTIAEIARQLNVSEKAIEYHITRALSHLRTSLKPYLYYIIILGIF